MIQTDANFPKGNIYNDYIDVLNPESCRAMLAAVYEPHYEHFGEYFGNTFVGFFSDEPGFKNRPGTYSNKLGLMYEIYPWRDDLPRLIAESAGVSQEDVWRWMPALWEDLGDRTALIRSHYMDVVTRLYQENLPRMLGEWCHAHGMMYIGHVIEDQDTHMRMSYGSGHFFRSLDGQDMSGIDIVLMQDIPGFNDSIHRAPIADGGIADPAFFRYTLPKLAPLASIRSARPFIKGSPSAHPNAPKISHMALPCFSGWRWDWEAANFGMV